MLLNIPGNFAKHFGECHQTFWGMLRNVPGNMSSKAVWLRVFGASLGDWFNGGYVDIYSRVVSVVLFLWGVGPILKNGYGN